MERLKLIKAIVLVVALVSLGLGCLLLTLQVSDMQNQLAEIQRMEQKLSDENTKLREELEQLKAGNHAKSDFNEHRAALGQPDAVSGYWSTPQWFAVGQLLEYRASLRHTLIGDEPTAWGKY